MALAHQSRGQLGGCCEVNSPAWAGGFEMTLCGCGDPGQRRPPAWRPPALAPRHPKGLANASPWHLRQPVGFPRMGSLHSPLSHKGYGSREILALGLLTPNPSWKESKDVSNCFLRAKNPSHIRVSLRAWEGTDRRDRQTGRLWEGAGRAAGRVGLLSLGPVGIRLKC